jgi:hypothetical protein
MAQSTGAVTATAAGSPNQPVATLTAAALIEAAISTMIGMISGARWRTR